MKILVTCMPDELKEVFARMNEAFRVKDYYDLNEEDRRNGVLEPQPLIRILLNCEPLLARKDWVPKENLICVDLETTGLSPYYDEILQVTILDGYGKVLLNEYCRPEHVESWEEAEEVNHITPGMVRDKKPFSAYVPQINKIFEDAEIVVGYNSNNFDLEFLKNAGVQIDAGKEKRYYDVMEEFAPIYGEWNEYHHDYRWQTLWSCANYYHYDPKRVYAFDRNGHFYEADAAGYTANPHDSLTDAKATLFCYYAVEQDLAERRLICDTAE